MGHEPHPPGPHLEGIRAETSRILQTAKMSTEPSGKDSEEHSELLTSILLQHQVFVALSPQMAQALRAGLPSQQAAPPSPHNSLSSAKWHLLQEPFHPSLRHSLVHRQATAVLRPRQEVTLGGAGGARSCTGGWLCVVSPISLIRGDRRGQTLSVWRHSTVPASLHSSQIRCLPALSSGRGHRWSVNNPRL